MNSSWSRLFNSRPRPVRRPARRARLIPRLERLEAREAPAIRFLGSFPGLNSADGGGSEPPDTTLAVGPSKVIEEVNVAVALYDRAGTRLDFMSQNQFYGRGNGDFL